MALSEAASKAKIVAALTAVLGTPQDPAQAALLAEALAIAINNILTQDAQVIVGGGSSSGTYGIS